MGLFSRIKETASDVGGAISAYKVTSAAKRKREDEEAEERMQIRTEQLREQRIIEERRAKLRRAEQREKERIAKARRTGTAKKTNRFGIATPSFNNSMPGFGGGFGSSPNFNPQFNLPSFGLSQPKKTSPKPHKKKTGKTIIIRL